MFSCLNMPLKFPIWNFVYQKTRNSERGMIQNPAELNSRKFRESKVTLHKIPYFEEP
jgi:hypothetical protein